MQDHEGFITKPRKRKWSPSQHHGLEDFYSDRKAYSNHFLGFKKLFESNEGLLFTLIGESRKTHPKSFSKFQFSGA